jgi:RES domain-containing protein
MTKLSAETFRGVVYRQCEVNYTDLDTTIEHNRRRGGRFSPPGEFGAIYVAVEQATALQELARHAALIGFTVDELLPRTMLRLRLHARHVLDLTDDAVCRTWGLDSSDMTQTSRDVCWEIARAAHRAGYEAIRFRSATGHGECMAVFKDRLYPGSYLDIEDAEIIATVDT